MSGSLPEKRSPGAAPHPEVELSSRSRSPDPAEAIDVSAGGGGARGGAMGPLCYESDDHTMARPPSSRPPRVMVLPRRLLPPARWSAEGLPTTPTTACDAAAVMLRLPHPRHGGPLWCLCPTAASLSGREAALYEIQAQGPPGGFAQTWFVDDHVIPGDDLLVATPLDLRFIVLHHLLHTRPRRVFCPPEILLAEVPGGPETGSDVSAAPATTETADGLLSAYRGAPGRTGGGPHDDDDDDVSRMGAWPGWDAAARASPALLACRHALLAHDVWASLCEVQSVEGTWYYRFSREIAAAWVAGRVRRVQASAALREVLQCGADVEVPVETAFGLVAEYVDAAVAAEAGRLCGLVEAPPAASSSPTMSGPRETSKPLETSKPMETLRPNEGRTGAGTKSVHLRRLEKAGRPAGTPTLMDMFAKQSRCAPAKP